MLMLYLMQGMPAAAQFLIIVCTASMSRSRCGLCPSMIAGFRSRSMWLDARLGGVITARLSLFRSTISRCRVELVDRRVEASRLGDLGVCDDVGDAVARDRLEVLVLAPAHGGARAS